MKIDFEVKGAQITSKNDRAEMHGDQKKIRVDVDFKATVEVALLEKLAEGDDRAKYESMLFDEKGQVKTLGLKKLMFDREYKEHTALIKLKDLREQEITLNEVTVKKFAAEPAFGKNAVFSFQVQCTPNDEELVFLSHAMTMRDLTVVVTSPDTVDEEKTESQENLI